MGTILSTTTNMISPRTLLFVAFVAMFAMTMAVPDAEPKAEAEAEPAYYYGGAQNGPHSYYYKGYNGYNGHHGYRAYSGFNGQHGFNGHSGHYNQYHYNYPSLATRLPIMPIIDSRNLMKETMVHYFRILI